MISKKEKLKWLGEACDYLGEPIATQPMEEAILQDIEDADNYRNNCSDLIKISPKEKKELKKLNLQQNDRFELAANNYEQGLYDGMKSCAASSWCFDMSKAPRDRTECLILFRTTEGNFHACSARWTEWKFQNGEEGWYCEGGIMSVEAILAWATINPPSEDEIRRGK